MRPIEPLLAVLRAQGVRIKPEDTTQMPFTIESSEGLQGDNIEIDGSESGQFISALLMAAPFAKTTTIIETYQLVNRPFVDMTCAMMADFGVLVRRMHHERFGVPPPQPYTSKNFFF